MRYLILLLLCLGMAFPSQSQNVGKQTEIDHYDAVTGLRITVERTGKLYFVRLTLPTQVTAELVVDDNDPAKGLGLHVKRTDGQVGFTRGDIMIIRNFAERGGPELERQTATADDRARQLAKSLIGMSSEAPVGVKIDVSGRGRPATLSASLCHQGGQPGVATYTLASGKVVSKTVTIGKCNDTTGVCLGRCGAGCNGVSNGGITQNCLNHDVCAGDTGSNMSPPCLDEFIAAIDDFANAPDCSSLTGTWTVPKGSQYDASFVYSLKQSGETITGAVDTGRQCGVYQIAGTHVGIQTSWNATRPAPISGCCTSFNSTGVCDGCDTVNMTTFRCGNPDDPHSVQINRKLSPTTIRAINGAKAEEQR